MKTEQQTYEELCYYTLNHVAPSFIHQHVVDAFAAQTAGPNDKPVRLVFALVGLYLHVEKHYNGRQVQLAHMKLGRIKQAWPAIALPGERGALTVKDVMSVPPGPERDEIIHQWCLFIWDAFGDNQEVISDLLVEQEII